MHAALTQTDHRPWPIPSRAWTWRQSWKDLLFAHWPVSVDVLRPLVPKGLEIQQFDGTSWVGVVPFRMTGVMRRPFPDLPGVSAFPELNVRLYVERDDKPGVWFLSLDAGNALAVWGAKRWFHLPYYFADMSMTPKGEGFDFSSKRRTAFADTASKFAAFSSSYRPVSPVFEAKPGTLEHFLTERYCMYAMSRDGTMYRGDVHHAPWPLQQGSAEIDATDLLATHRLEVQGAPVLHFSAGVDVIVWSLERLTSS
jgi:uncharacterized protein YqjF (DUF2071 family)